MLKQKLGDYIRHLIWMFEAVVLVNVFRITEHFAAKLAMIVNQIPSQCTIAVLTTPNISDFAALYCLLRNDDHERLSCHTLLARHSTLTHVSIPVRAPS